MDMTCKYIDEFKTIGNNKHFDIFMTTITY